MCNIIAAFRDCMVPCWSKDNIVTVGSEVGGERGHCKLATLDERVHCNDSNALQDNVNTITGVHTHYTFDVARSSASH